MRIAYLECFSGISGDMFLGALLDAGVPPEVFTRTVEALGVDARLEISRVDRSGISATKLDVIAAGEKELPREEFWEEALGNQNSALSTQNQHQPGNRFGRRTLAQSGTETRRAALPRHFSAGGGACAPRAWGFARALAFPDTAEGGGAT